MVSTKYMIGVDIGTTSTKSVLFSTDGSVIATERTNQVPGQIDIEGNEAPLPATVNFGKLGVLK